MSIKILRKITKFGGKDYQIWRKTDTSSRSGKLICHRSTLCPLGFIGLIEYKLHSVIRIMYKLIQSYYWYKHVWGEDSTANPANITTEMTSYSVVYPSSNGTIPSIDEKSDTCMYYNAIAGYVSNSTWHYANHKLKRRHVCFNTWIQIHAVWT